MKQVISRLSFVACMIAIVGVTGCGSEPEQEGATAPAASGKMQTATKATVEVQQTKPAKSAE